MLELASLAVDQELAEAELVATNLDVFRIGVSHWSTHRIHYDEVEAVKEGFDDVVVTGTLL